MTLTELNYITLIQKNELFKEKQQEFSALIDRIVETEKCYKESGVSDYFNLKIYHANGRFYQLVDMGIYKNHEEAYSDFNFLCEVEYENFQEFKSQFKHISRQRVGRTSSYYYDILGTDTLVLDTNLSNVSLLQDYEGELTFGGTMPIVIALNNQFSTEHNKGYALSELVDVSDLQELNSDELNEHIEDVIQDLTNYNDDISHELDNIEAGINEIEQVHNFLKEYKTEENESELVNSFVENHIENIAIDNLMHELRLHILDTVHEKQGKTGSLVSLSDRLLDGAGVETSTYEIAIEWEHEYTYCDFNSRFNWDKEQQQDVTVKYFKKAMQCALVELAKEFSYL